MCGHVRAVGEGGGGGRECKGGGRQTAKRHEKEGSNADVPSVVEQKILDFNPIGHALLKHRRREEKREMRRK